jgi:hypothetical protein
MTTIIGGSSPSITFSDNTTQTTAFTTGAVTQTTIGTNVAGTGPAFSAYASASQSTPSSNVFTKVVFDTEDFDTNSNFSSNRFTPTIAGYYQVNATVAFSATVNNFGCRIFKNGSDYSTGTEGAVAMYGAIVSALIYMNGSTDYLEIYSYVNTGTFYGHSAGGGYPRYTFFNGSLVRGV